jgi:hypothetical protein
MLRTAVPLSTSRARLPALFLSLFLAGCSTSGMIVDAGNHPDAGPDAGDLDAGDAGDGGPPDAGPSDAGPSDAGVTAHRLGPQVPGNAAMNPVSLVTIVASNEDNAANLFLFSDTLVASSWWSALSQSYGTDAHPDSLHVTGPAINADMSASDQFAYIQNAITNAGNAPPDGTRLYLLYLPGDYQFSDTTACAHHGVATTYGDEFAVVRHCVYDDQSIFQHQTISASHEIAEAVTDPDVGGYRLPAPPAIIWEGSVWDLAQPGSVEIADLRGHAHPRGHRSGLCLPALLAQLGGGRGWRSVSSRGGGALLQPDQPSGLVPGDTGPADRRSVHRLDHRGARPLVRLPLLHQWNHEPHARGLRPADRPRGGRRRLRR